MSHHIYTTPGFIIGSRNMGEANRYFHIFTKELGMIGASAQGVRLEKSKLRYHAQDFSYACFSLVRGKDVWRLTSAVSENDFSSIIQGRQEVFLLYCKVLVLLKRLLHGEEKHEELFDVIKNGFIFLSSADMTHEELCFFEYLIVVRVVHLLGYVGKTNELERFLKNEWNREIVAEVAVCKKKIIAEINRALQESQL